MKVSRAFDRLRKPIHKLLDNPFGLISDEKWHKILYDHDDASMPRTSQ